MDRGQQKPRVIVHRQPADCTMSLAPRYNGQFPGGPGSAGTRTSPFWILFGPSMMEVVSGDNWSCRTYKAPVKINVTTNKPTLIFLQADALPVAQPTVSEHLRKRLHHVCCEYIPHAQVSN